MRKRIPRQWLRVRLERLTPTEILRRFGFHSPPVDVFILARRLEIEVHLSLNADFSGSIVGSAKRGAHIIVNSSEPHVRQRFTIAHEIGHLMLHPLGLAWRDITFAGSQQETEANSFAANLLMPGFMLSPMFRTLGPDIDKLSRVFLVSPSAMEIRLERMIRPRRE